VSVVYTTKRYTFAFYFLYSYLKTKNKNNAQAKGEARVKLTTYAPSNPLNYSDTDSAVLPLPLSEKFTGNFIVQMSLVNKIEEGFFIGAKLYCYINNKKEVVIASAGIDPKLLNVNEFKNLLKEQI